MAAPLQPSPTPRRLTSAALATTLVAWASAFVFIRVALPGLGVAALTVGRLVVASITLALLVPFLRFRRPARADLPRLAACGLFGMVAYQLLLNTGERSVAAGTASLLMATGPAFAAVLAVAMLGERVTRRTALGIALGFTGAAIMALSHTGSVAIDTDGLLILGAALCQALFFVVQKPLLVRYSGFEVTTYATWFAAVLALPLLPFCWSAFADATPKSWASMVYLGVVASAVGFATWAHSQSQLSVAGAANTLYLVPFIAIAIGRLLLGETVAPVAVVGGFIAMSGVALTRSRPSRHERSSGQRRRRRSRQVC